MSATALPACEGNGQYVTLGLDGDVFAVDVRSVSEILDLRPAVHVPDAPPFLYGLIDVRGRAVPVVNLRTKVGLPTVPPTEQTRILVLEAMIGDSRRMIGLLVDRVFEVTELDEHRAEAPPDLGRVWRSGHVAGIGRRNGSFVLVFSLDTLLSGCDAATFAADAAQ